MGSSKTKVPKKEKDFHPSSRKAGQLARKALRKGKLGNLAKKRGEKQNSLADVYGFFYHALPEDGVLTLQELHVIIRDIWLTRFDKELDRERAERRKGRPKSTKETRLEEIKSRELDEYRAGLELPDLTHPATVELFRHWDQKELAYMQLLRFIRINSTEPDVAVLLRQGKHPFVVTPTEKFENQDQEMVDAETDRC